MPVPKQQICTVGAMLFAFAAVHAVAVEEKLGSETLDVSALAVNAQKSVVVVRQSGRDGKEYGIGAGFVVAADGLIATCLHVIGEARPITVELADGRRLDVTEI